MGLPEKVALFDYIDVATNGRLRRVSRTNARDIHCILLKDPSCNKNPELTITNIVEHLEHAEERREIQRTRNTEMYLQVYRETNQYSEEELRQFVFYELKKK